jgi:hypothetical protein
LRRCHRAQLFSGEAKQPAAWGWGFDGFLARSRLG